MRLLRTNSSAGKGNCLSQQLATRAILKFSIIAIVLALPAMLSAAIATTTQTLQANISPEGAFSTSSYNFSLAKTGTIFTGFSGVVTVLYRARTGSSVSTAGITLKASADFAPAGGPSISTPPSTGDTFSYTCSTPTLGIGCSGTQAVSTTSARPVVTFPASACTGAGAPCNNADPNSVTLNFSLTDDPKYKTGSYTTTLQFTISSI